MALIVFEHHPLETAGRLGTVLNEQGHRLRHLQLHRGDPVPPDLDDVDGVIAMGGPMNVNEADQHDWMTPELDFLKAAHEADLPVVGICLGAQLIAHALGGTVEAMDTPEIGLHPIKASFFGTTDPIHLGLPWEMPMFHAHAQHITTPPPGGTPAPLYSSPACNCEAFRVGLNTYGFQYHFEWTRRMIEMLVHDDPDFYGRGGTSPEELIHQLGPQYDLYRHLGDRLCRNLAHLLFPLDKRLAPSGADVTNFRSS
jgi:GMP synthase (glutamine-hydrolysing)